MKQQAQREEVAFEEFCREIVHATRADEEVVNAAADSVFLYQRVRAQLAAEPELKPGFFDRLFGGRQFMRWAMAATAMVAMIAIAVATRWPGPTPQPPAFAIALTQDGLKAPTPVTAAEITRRTKEPAASVTGGKAAASLRPRINKREQEVTTEYMPLTYATYTDEADSGHVVRVQVPRAALLALGVRMSGEPSAELVKADVIVGDDGLARAIRLVR